MTESNVPQLVDKKRGSYSVIAPRIEVGKFNKWNKCMLCYLTGMEPYYITCINDGPFQPKTAEGLVAKTFDWDEEEVSDDEEIVQVKVLMALADDELVVWKNHAKNSEWIDISMRKFVFEQAKLEAVTFQLQNTEIIKLNHALQEQCNTPKMGHNGMRVRECYFIDQ
ncbi:hypothetical protein Tco_0959921 [Tanacetum coccineum]